MKSKNEIVIYQADDFTRVEVKIGEDTVWLNRQQIAELFNRDIKTIGKHINNVFSEGELMKEVVVAKFATTTQHGAIEGKTQIRNIEFYNLDVIISVGYRVKSRQGTQFRIWANKVLKDYLLKGYSLNNRMNRIEDKVDMINQKVEQIDLQVNTTLPPVQGVFFNGQIFDAYSFVTGLIRKAKNSIIIIDNYIDETVLTMLQKREQGVKAEIYTQNLSKQLKLDIEKYNSQYSKVTVQKFADAHDRFFIIDRNEVYHLGASIKDLGKKWFAFTKIEDFTNTILSKLEGNYNE